MQINMVAVLTNQNAVFLMCIYMELWIIISKFIFSHNATSTGLVLISLKTMHSMIFIEKNNHVYQYAGSSTALQKSMSFVLNNALEDHEFSE